MNSNLRIHVASVIALVALTACGTGSIDLESAAAPGDPLSADVSPNPDGTYHADRLLVSKALTSSADGDDGDDVECEDGVAPDGSACADDDDGEDEAADTEDDTDGDDVECEDGVGPDGSACADDDDGEDEAADTEDDTDGDDVECEDGVAPDGSACADDDDGEDEAADTEDDTDGDDVECEDGVAPDGSACADDDDGEDEAADTEDDADGDGDVDEDDARYAAGGAAAFINGVPSLIDGRNVYSLFGVEINPGGATVPEGAVRFDGGYANGYLAATQTAPGTSTLSVGGPSESVASTGHGTWTIQLLGQTLIVDDSTEIVPVSSPLQGEDESASDEDDDGVDCQQDGEHEGDNEGC